MKRQEILQRIGLRLPESKQIRVIVYSDVKNEADDQFAVMHHLLTPSFDVRGVIAAHFESKAPGTRTTMQKSYEELEILMAAAGMDDVPMLHGCDAPMQNDSDTPDSEGVQKIIEEALKDDPRPLFVAAQGCLTDVGAALNRCPEIAQRMTLVWIGGGAYPTGGKEFNLKQDVSAARVCFDSEMPIWQIPLTAYGAMNVTMAELKYRVRPQGKAGEYLYEQIAEFNYISPESYALRKGENWCLGDQPSVWVLLDSDWGRNFHMQRAPSFNDDMTYAEPKSQRLIRVYDSIDPRVILEDFYAKLALAYGG